MDYRFSITPRLLILAAVSLLALFILLFLLGLFVGQRLGPVSALEPSNMPKLTAPTTGALPAALTPSAAAAAPPTTPAPAAPAVQAKP
jgi:hypothetical protein